MQRKILIFSIAYFPIVGGAELAIKEITDRINDVQFDLITLRFNKKLPKFEKIGNVNVYRIAFSNLLPLKINKIIFPFIAWYKGNRMHKKNRYDAIWAMMANYAGFAALFFKLTHSKVPYLLTLQEGDPLPETEKKVKIVYPMFKKIFIKADFIQAISNYLADWAKKMGFKGLLEVVPNGVDVQIFSQEYPEAELAKLKDEFKKNPNDIFLITTSRLVRKNAIDDVIKALQYLPENIKFLILGSGPELKILQNLTKNLKLEQRVFFLGHIDYKEIPKYLKISDIFIRPSLSEGMGNSFIEAMTAGIPVIATPVGGIVDFLKDEETGVFCEVRNPLSIAEKVNLILKDENLRTKIIKNAKEIAVKNYDWDLIAKKIKRIFNQLWETTH